MSTMGFLHRHLVVATLLFGLEAATAIAEKTRRALMRNKIGTTGLADSRVVELTPKGVMKLEPLHDKGVDGPVHNQTASTDMATSPAANPSSDAQGDGTTTSNALIRAWFDKHGLSNDVQKLRSANPDTGDGIADPNGGSQWNYFLNSCMQRRQEVVAREVLDRKCERVIEVGGYLTPLDGFLQKLHGNKSAPLPVEYLNIDPSAKAARITKAGGMRSVHVPMTVADFVSESSQDFRKQFQLEGVAKTCLVVLSIWDPHVKRQADRLALGMLLGKASFAALASANDEMRHLRVVEKLARLTGLKGEPNKSERFDCTESLEHETSHYPGDEVENLHIMSLDADAFESSRRAQGGSSEVMSSLVERRASQSQSHLAADVSSQRRGTLIQHVRFVSRIHNEGNKGPK